MNDGEEIRFIEMFAGIGGFRLGLERTNLGQLQQEMGKPDRNIMWRRGRKGTRETVSYKCVWANENDKYANQIYKKNFGNKELVEGDIREIKAKSIPDCDLLTAGFPCQAFSIAGKRKATKEARGTLFTHIIRVASAKRPKLLLLENVKGILSSESGRTFAIILRTLANLGYLLEWQVLNSKHYGVPQNRERVFIIGHLRGKGGQQIFPIGETGKLSHRTAANKPKSREASTLEASYGKNKSLSNMIQVGELWKGSQCRVYDPEGIAPTVHKSGGNTEPVITVANAVDCDGYLRFGHRPRDENGKPQLIPIGYRRIRRLTPIECERLQGFPDGWTEGVSDTQRYKCLGNAVTVNVIEFLGRQIRESLIL